MKDYIDDDLTLEIVTVDDDNQDSCGPNCRPAVCSPVMEVS